jgi:hypothetical protein
MNENTPEESPNRAEYRTPTRVRFFQAYDSQSPSKTLRQVCRDVNIPPTTGSNWIRQRKELGELAYRRTRRTSVNKLGRPEALEDSQLDDILAKHSGLHYDTIVDKENLPITGYTLRRNLSKRVNARRYRKARTSTISDDNKSRRQRYGKAHEDKRITLFWQYVYFTDECHFNSQDLATRQEYELRRPGGQQRLRNLQETRKATLNVTLHVSAGISYNHKGPLLFYNDPKDPTAPRPYRPGRPRRSSVQTEEEYNQVVTEWEARRAIEQDPRVELKPKGNSMTQEFYAREVLPSHIEHMKWLQEHYDHEFFFQEDNDPSHGTRSIDNAPRRVKNASGLTLLTHPAQSPDLNPIESIWQIMKQRLRGGRWRNVEAFKRAIEREWRRVTISQIRNRISSMKARSSEVIEQEGKRIRSDKW